jgi:GR25 family glycosyltransferase involved in LPS biosynthesis
MNLNNVMNSIDKLYYINLDKRPDRNEHFINECNKASIPSHKIKRFSGFDGNTYEFDEDDIALFQRVDYRGKPFEKKIIGNQLSHYYILKEMVEKRYNYIIICQDDVIFRNNFMSQLDKVMNNIPSDAEIINIGFHKFAAYEHFVPWDLSSTNDFDEIGAKKVNDHVCHLKNTINPCSLAYIVTLKGAINLLVFFKRYGFFRATDWNYNDYLNHKNIFYGTNTVLCTGNPDLGSDIFGK